MTDEDRKLLHKFFEIETTLRGRRSADLQEVLAHVREAERQFRAQAEAPTVSSNIGGGSSNVRWFPRQQVDD